MDRSIPAAAASILAFIYKGESGGDYNMISSRKQKLLKKQVTAMSINELLADQVTWRSRLGTLSSAAGAAQIINKTLLALKSKLGMTGKEKFDANMQDRLAYQLLRDRGYDAWTNGRIDTTEFAKRLAQEWASLPVLAGTKNAQGRNIRRGQGYYDGDGLNSASHVSADKFEQVLNDALLNKQTATVVKPADTKPVATTKYVAAAGTGVAIVGGAADATSSITDWQPVIELASTVGRYGPWVAGAIVAGIGIVYIAKRVWK